MIQGLPTDEALDAGNDRGNLSLNLSENRQSNLQLVKARSSRQVAEN